TPYFDVCRCSQGLRKTLQHPANSPGPADNYQQTQQCICCGQPPYSAAGERASKSKSQKADQQSQILDVRKDPDFDSNPADYRSSKKIVRKLARRSCESCQRLESVETPIVSS